MCGRSWPAARCTSATVASTQPTGGVRTDDPGAPNDSASWVGTFITARAGTIYAGTSQVQRNILAEAKTFLAGELLV